MSSLIASFQILLRKLAVAATVFSLIGCGLAQVEILVFLRPMQVPMLVISGCIWAAYSFACVITDPHRNRIITSAEGPGGELVQKATLSAMKSTTSGKADLEEAEKYFVRGERAFAAFRYIDGFKSFEAAAAAYPSTAAHLNCAAALMNLSDFTKAEQILYVGLQMADLEHRRDLQGAFWANLAIVHNRLGKLEAAMKDCEQAVSLFQTVSDSRGTADVMLTIGNIHANQGNLDDAERAFRNAKKRHELVSSEIGQANALGNIGNMLMQRDDSLGALDCHQKALLIQGKIGNPLGKANALSNIGNVYLRSENFDEALKAHKTGLALYKKISAHLGEATALGNIGNVQFKQGHLKTAFESYSSALEVHGQIGNVLGRANTMTNLGSLLIRMGRREEALRMLLSAQRLYEATGVQTKGTEAVTELLVRLDLEGH